MRLAWLLAGMLLASPAYADMFPDASNAALPAARANLGIGGGVSAAQYDADGTGATDASAALGAACTAAVTAGKPLALAGTYKISANLTLNCDIADMGGSRLLPDSGKAITHSGSVTAADTAYLFGGAGTTTLTNAPYVSVQWWGAGHGLADDAPAFRSAMGSQRIVNIPPGSYTMASQLVAPPSAMLPSAFQIDGLTGVTVLGYGATLKMAAANTNISLFRVMNSRGIKVAGLTFEGNRTGLTALTNNGAMSFLSVVDMHVEDIHLTGNWGGRSKFADGVWIVGSTFRNLTLDAVGICFDMAFLKGVVFDRIWARSAAPDGTQTAGNGGGKCYGNAYDAVNNGHNTTGVTYADTDGVTFSNSDIAGFGTGVGIFSGQNYLFHGNNWHDNAGVVSNVNIVDAVWASTAGGQATYTTESPVNLAAGTSVVISGMVPAGYNGTFTLLAGSGASTMVVALTPNPGLATTMGTVAKPSQGHAITIGYLNSGKYSSVGFPPKHIKINDMIINTGSAVPGRAVFLSPALITNSDVIEDINISGLFWNNSTIAIGANAVNSLSTISVTGSTFGGASQVVDIESALRTVPGFVGQANVGVQSPGMMLERRIVSALPTCSAGAEGGMYAVSDANSVVFNAAVAAGGANKVVAYCNGTGWVVH